MDRCAKSQDERHISHNEQHIKYFILFIMPGAKQKQKNIKQKNQKQTRGKVNDDREVFFLKNKRLLGEQIYG